MIVSGINSAPNDHPCKNACRRQQSIRAGIEKRRDLGNHRPLRACRTPTSSGYFPKRSIRIVRKITHATRNIVLFAALISVSIEISRASIAPIRDPRSISSIFSYLRPSAIIGPGGASLGLRPRGEQMVRLDCNSIRSWKAWSSAPVPLTVVAQSSRLFVFGFGPIFRRS